MIKAIYGGKFKVKICYLFAPYFVALEFFFRKKKVKKKYAYKIDPKQVTDCVSTLTSNPIYDVYLLTF